MDTNVWNYVDSLFGHMTRIECDWLASQAASAQCWVELGSFCGRSLAAVALHLPRGARLVSVDWQSGTIQRAGQTLYSTVRELATMRPDIEFALIRGDSARSAEWLPGADVVFVDADHARAAVAKDIAAWYPKCRLLCGHDFPMEGVRAGLVDYFGERAPVAPVAGAIWSVPGALSQ
jgi:hypothetical protein